VDIIVYTMKRVTREFIYVVILLLLLGGFYTAKTNAASLSSSSDTLTTSRPSVAAPLNADQVVGDQAIQVVDIPGSTSTQF